MGIGKNHEQKKSANYKTRRQKFDETKSIDEVRIANNEDAIANRIALNRDRGLPVEGYKPLYKELLKQFPIEKRY